MCTSHDPRDHRLRVSALIRIGNKNIAIDCGPDFRQQMLRANITSLDAILMTHEHNDHVIGLDDVRPFNFRQQRDMAIYATMKVQQELRQRFAYAFEENPYPGAPRFRLHTIAKDAPFQVEGIPVAPIEVMHGGMPVLGFRIGDFTYLTDVKTVSDIELEKIKGSKVLVTSALHHAWHHSHANLEEALALVAKVRPEQAFFTHISHSMGLYEELSKTLPPGIALAYDGLEIQI
ncbi:MAG: MBL fold metallo-hydrolase [Saprospiraceae bacterium]|nr:MBL fold metallo-hydrolase [Saprospiraceae bacterium]